MVLDMKKLTALFRTEKGGNVKYNSTDYFKTKKAYEQDLKSYGYIVLGIYTEEQIVDVKQKFAVNEVEEFIQENVPAPKGIKLLEPKRVDIGSYYKMQDGTVKYAGYYGELVLHALDGSGTAERYDVEVFNKALTRGEIEEVFEVEEMYSEPVEGISIFSGEPVEIIGEKLVIKEDGTRIEQYLYNIKSYEAKNGKPFLSLKANIVRLY
jgi:hypothetical protein